MGVLFENGVTCILVIDTDSYAGNFERQLTGYATGIYDERYHGEEEAEAAREADELMTDNLQDKSRRAHHTEYGEIACDIWPTQGRINIGGASADEADWKPGMGRWPSYESVAIFFDSPLNKDELAFIEKRAREYADANGIVIKSIYQVERITQSVERLITAE